MHVLNADFREGNDPGDELTVTYRELLQRVCQFANVLKAQGELSTRWHRPLSALYEVKGFVHDGFMCSDIWIES